MASKESKPEEIYKIVVATDAGCRPNPGFMGCGAFGYMYDNNKLGKKTGDRPNKNLITDIGFIEDEIVNKYVLDDGEKASSMSDYDLELPREKYQHVTPEYYMHGIYSFLEDSTNNIGEILAMTITAEKIIELKKEYNIIEALFLIDSEYVIGIFNKIMDAGDKSWVSNVKTNLVYWEEIYKVIVMAREANIILKVRKIDGHSTALMNHLADRLATMGVFCSNRGDKQELFHMIPARRYWSAPDIRHPFLRFKQLYFVQAKRKQNQPGIYSIMNYPSDTEPGRKSHEATFGVVRLSSPQPMLETLMDIYQSNLRTLSIISSVSLDTAYGQMNTCFFDIFKERAYTFNHKRAILNLLDETPVVYAINPPGVANQALDHMMVLNTIIDEYRARDVNPTTRTYIDITDKFYGLDEKGKIKTLITNNDRCMLLDIEFNSHKVSIPLEIGKDCIDRNNFKQIEQDDPSVYLVVHQTSPKLLSYYILVDMKATDDISVWTNFYSNNKLLK